MYQKHSLYATLATGLNGDEQGSWESQTIDFCDKYFEYYNEYLREEKDEQTQIIEENAIYATLDV